VGSAVDTRTARGPCALPERKPDPESWPVAGSEALGLIAVGHRIANRGWAVPCHVSLHGRHGNKAFQRLSARWLGDSRKVMRRRLPPEAPRARMTGVQRWSIRFRGQRRGERGKSPPFPKTCAKETQTQVVDTTNLNHNYFKRHGWATPLLSHRFQRIGRRDPARAFLPPGSDTPFQGHSEATAKASEIGNPRSGKRRQLASLRAAGRRIAMAMQRGHAPARRGSGWAV
jgi:hypothetical protein